MPDTTAHDSDSATPDIRTAARGLTEGARNAATSMTDVVHNAASTLDDGRSAAAEGLDAAASALHDRAGNLPGGEAVRNAARATADRLGNGAEYVRTHDARRIMAGVEAFVTSNPGPAVAAAATFGFLLGLALARD